jgi:hypothetical protein
MPTQTQDLALARIITLREAAHLAGISEDTLKRRWPSKIIRLSPRRLGMRVRDALMLGEGAENAA